MMRTIGLTVAPATALLAIALATPALAGHDNGNGPPNKEVLVINTPAQAVPVVTQGITAIQGNVAVINTPSVNVANTPGVHVLNTPTVRAQQDGGWAVSLLGTPRVDLVPGAIVGIDAAANHVRVTNTVDAPVLIRNVEDGRQPWATEAVVLCYAASVCTGLQAYGSFAVPAGKIYVIESLSVRAELSNGQRAFVALISAPPGRGGDARNWLPLSYQGTMLSPTMSMPDADMHVGSSSTRIYHDTDQPLNALVFRSDTRDLQVFFSASGYLLDRP